MTRFFYPLFCLVLVFCARCSDKQQAEQLPLQHEIDVLRTAYAPDKRTDRVEVNWRNDTLYGYTTRPEVMDSIDFFLKEAPTLVSTVRLLPDEVVGDKSVGIINVAVANLRSNPGHSQEMATQALLGTPVEVLDLVDGWYLVRTPDRYIAWLEPGAFVTMTAAQASAWFDDDMRLYVGTGGDLLEKPGGGRIISSLVAGGIVKYVPEVKENGFQQVMLPDGKTGWVLAEDVIATLQWWEPAPFSNESLLGVADNLAGRPYLWGGTSPNGMDCSGFTKMSYYLNGYVIPRDASQQVHAGEEVSLTEDFGNLKPGDQLFFGRYREDGSERITHTGFYLGKGRFLHAGADNGRIRENALIPGDKDFAEHRLESLLRARRLSAGTQGVVSVSEAFQKLWN